MSNAPSLVLLPAVDVASGRAVRLRHAQAGSAVEYGDALTTALEWQHAGASWVHLVDIDAAFGRGSNHELLAAIVRRLDVAVQLSGGVHTADALDRALSTGCARVNLGTAALLEPSFVARAIERHGNRIAVGLDLRGTRLVARGSDVDAGELSEVLATLEDAGCARYIVTDVSRDGALSGPNVPLLREVCALTDRPVVASGGVGSLADLAVLRELGRVEGAIIGQALYTGQFTLQQALAVAGAQPRPDLSWRRPGAGGSDAGGSDVGDPGISMPPAW